MLKRTFDIVMSLFGLLVLSPIILGVAILVPITSKGPVLFRQIRIGRRFKPFRINKFRTMVPDAPQRGGVITVGDDPRITPVGRWLRKTKMDELPQLLNVFLGDMSFVGPRPEAEKYVEMFREDYAEILQVRPGITDLASIKYRDESTLLAQASDPESEYVHHVLPEKIRLAKEYIRQQSLLVDIKIIMGTLWRLVGDRVTSRSSDQSRTITRKEITRNETG